MARIQDYAIIGDTHTCALVSAEGSIDWLCVPRFDSPACFAALLGTPENGRWSLRPSGTASATRAYVEDTAVLRTVFSVATGQVEVLDFMPHPSREDEVDVVRIVRGLSGEVEMEMDLAVRFDYGAIVPWVQRTEWGLSAIAGPNGLDFRSPVSLVNEDFRTQAKFTVSPGDTFPFELTWYPSHVQPGGGMPPLEDLETTLEWWRAWSQRFTGAGPHRDLAVRSLITLKLLTYGPTGGLVAAPTTSLPEWPGSTRNWDYRYCWLRDATFALYALLISGYPDEARAWREWLVRAVAGKPDQLQIMFGLAGERLLPEREVDWLPGYEGSVPVRVGNAAHRQFQLDVYGAIMDCFHVARRAGIEPNVIAWRLQRELLATLEHLWREPDEGLWEVRGPRRHFTHSKMMAWVAFDRGVKAAERYGLEGPVDQWRKLRDEVHSEVCQRGFDPVRNSFVQSYGSSELDASLLMIPLVGFLPPDDPRVLGTIEAIRKELSDDGVFVRRYRWQKGLDGLPPGEGAFLPCSFWLADALIMAGQYEEGRELFERVIEACNDVGLLAEEYDPFSGEQLGNFPQAFSHLALINTVQNLARYGGSARRRSNPGP